MGGLHVENRRRSACRQCDPCLDIWRQGKAGNAAGATLRHPHLHGRPARPCEIRRPRRGRCACHSQRWWTRDRRCDPLPGDIDKLLGTLEWFVIHHTNCGMELFSDGVMADLLEDDLGTAAFDGKKWSNSHHRGGHAAGHFIKWHTIANQAASVLQDVRRIREHSLVPAAIPIYGYVYDVYSGHLEEVKAATEAGRAAA